MNKKLFINNKYNVGIVESYKANKETQTKDGPVIGSFDVKGMTAENVVSQNRTKYSTEVWAQPTAFGKGGKFIDENGKLKPTTLFGSVDHPLDDRAELLLNEAAIVWHDVHRNDDGSWDGSAHILNNPQGRIVKTFLDYAKEYGGGSLLGVSSRALGESIVSESAEGQVESIVPESFELMSFDFVYNPSFQTAVAHLTESKKMKKNLVESVKALAKEDEEHAEVYEQFAEKLEKEAEVKKEGKSIEQAKADYYKQLRIKEKELHDAIYEAEDMDDDEFKKQYGKDRDEIISKMKRDYNEVVDEIKKLKSNKSENIEPKEETIVEANKTIDDFVKDAKEAELAGESEEEELEEELEDEELEEELEDEEIEEELEDEEIEEELEDKSEDEGTLLQKVYDLLVELKDYLIPVENPEEEFMLGEDDEEFGDEESLLDEEDEELTLEDEDDLVLDDIDEDDLDLLSEEELEWLANLKKEED